LRSLRARLLILWAFSLAACVAAGALLVQISAQSTTAQVQRGEAVVARACDLIRERYAYYVTGWRGPVPSLDDAVLRRDLNAAVFLALARQAGVEGGIWQTEAGPLAYAYPTYSGTAAKTDVPVAELASIRAANEQASRDESTVARASGSSSQTLLLHACPLPGPIDNLTAWTMARVQTAAAADELRAGLGLLFVLMAAMSAWLAWLLRGWSRQVGAVEAGLARYADDAPPALPRTGERDLDRIVDALNQAGQRLIEARRRSAELGMRVVAAERLAALGRVAAGVAHEIRNPLAAMRLRAENGLAGDDERRQRALAAVLGQIGRLDRLLGELLAMTQRREPTPKPVDLAAVLATCRERHLDQAAAAGVGLVAQGAGNASLDEALIGRALDNLVANAIQHTPRGGEVRMQAERTDGVVRLIVEDAGPGVAPELCGTLFEPFVTGRADGTGLGLAIARELVEAHGGRLSLVDAERGARFVIELGDSA
jgi:signal transduction histidine kinase